MELMKCGSTFGPKELGEGPKHRNRSFLNKRIECLDRVRLRSPPLPLAMEAQWERRKLAFARGCCFWYKDSTGAKVLKQISMLIVELGEHNDGRLTVKEKL